MVINVSGAICHHTSEKIFINRIVNSKWEDGLFIKGKVKRLKALASVQQPTPKQLEVLPEGERDKDIMLFICNKKLRTISDMDEIEADIVLWSGKEFKIISLGDWSTYGATMGYGARVK